MVRPSVHVKVEKKVQRTHLPNLFLTDDELKNQLLLMRDRLDDPVLISSDLVMNMLLAFREIQDYNSMVKLVEDLDSVAGYSGNYQRTDHISFLYAFALNRRKAAGERFRFLL